jgi:4-diphosphocytidyl-2-C-methyl-D-erythritol kinase
MGDICLRAFAKINLFLEVVGRRSDGYHNIETVFQSIGLHDTLVIRKTDRQPQQHMIHCDSAVVPSDQMNLAWRAVALLQSHYPQIGAIDIEIQKRIPVAGGLGGGSANAAAVLFALNQLYDLKLTVQVLSQFGCQLGADVPFFLGGTALGKGIGDQLNPLKPLPELHVILANPGIHISTSVVFQNLKLPLTSEKRDVRIVARCVEQGLLPELGAGLFNRLEAFVLAKHPSVMQLKKELRRTRAYGTLMSGSGATVFSLASEMRDVQQTTNTLQCESAFHTQTAPTGLEIT